MDAVGRLKLLSAQMDLEPDEDFGCSKIPTRPNDISLSNAVQSGGKRILLVKTLLSSACERDCYYCPFRAGRDFRRVNFKPEELAQTFMSFYQAGIAQGIFLSSGITGKGYRTQDRLIDAAEILRSKLGYRGYLHLKIMPGSERAQVERTMQLADRVSVNLEAPNQQRLQVLAPGKQFLQELIRPLQWVEEIRQTRPAQLGWNGRWPSSVTQFVAGGAGESDLELLSTTEHLYRQLRLQRTYFMAFRPIPDTPMENQPAVSPLRERRLYQASFLIRDYQFSYEEFLFDQRGNLPVETDPKTAWAEIHLSGRPMEINLASHQELLRIPGVGPKGAGAILAARRLQKFRSLSELNKIGLNTHRIAPFIIIDGKLPTRQGKFW